MNFEKSLERLKEIVNKMESENTSLENSLELYTEGIKLYQECNQFLQKANRKIEILKNTKEIAENPKKEPSTELFPDIE